VTGRIAVYKIYRGLNGNLNTYVFRLNACPSHSFTDPSVKRSVCPGQCESICEKGLQKVSEDVQALLTMWSNYVPGCYDGDFRTDYGKCS
jgi:hypothetical protein